MASAILEFYRLQKPDSEGRMLEQIWRWEHQRLERVHDFIQWMFPLDEPSSVNPDAPLLTATDRAEFRQDPALQSAMRQSLMIFLDFLGLELRTSGEVDKAAHFNQRIEIWKYTNHNWLRITRMLKSLRLTNLETEAQNVWTCLQQLHESEGYVTERSFNYWRQAATDPIGPE